MKHSYKYKNLLYSFLFRKKVSLFERWHVGGRAKKRETYGNKGGEGSQKIPYLWWCHFLNVHTFVPCPSDAILTSSVFAGLDLLYLFTQNEYLFWVWFSGVLPIVLWNISVTRVGTWTEAYLGPSRSNHQKRSIKKSCS